MTPNYPATPLCHVCREATSEIVGAIGLGLAERLALGISTDAPPVLICFLCRFGGLEVRRQRFSRRVDEELAGEGVSDAERAATQAWLRQFAEAADRQRHG